MTWSAFNLCGQPVPLAKWWSQQTGQRLSTEDGKFLTQPCRWGLGHSTQTAQGADQVCTARSALLSIKYTTASGITITWRAVTLRAWQGAFVSHFKPKEPSSSTPKPFTLWHLQTADTDLPSAGQSHHPWSTSEAEVCNSCHRQQGWSAHTCHCRDLAQRIRRLALCCTAIHLSCN